MSNTQTHNLETQQINGKTVAYRGMDFHTVLRVTETHFVLVDDSGTFTMGEASGSITCNQPEFAATAQNALAQESDADFNAVVNDFFMA